MWEIYITVEDFQELPRNFLVSQTPISKKKHRKYYIINKI